MPQDVQPDVVGSRMSVVDFADEWEPLADDAGALYLAQPGCVRLQSGPGRCVVVQLAGGARPKLDDLTVEGLIVVDGVPLELGLDEAQITLVDKKAPRKQRF